MTGSLLMASQKENSVTTEAHCNSYRRKETGANPPADAAFLPLSVRLGLQSFPRSCIHKAQEARTLLSSERKAPGNHACTYAWLFCHAGIFFPASNILRHHCVLTPACTAHLILLQAYVSVLCLCTHTVSRTEPLHIIQEVMRKWSHLEDRSGFPERCDTRQLMRVMQSWNMTATQRDSELSMATHPKK